MNNIEAVMQMLPSTVQIKGFLDGAGLLNIPAAAWVWSWELETLPTISALRPRPSHTHPPSARASLRLRAADDEPFRLSMNPNPQWRRCSRS